MFEPVLEAYLKIFFITKYKQSFQFFIYYNWHHKLYIFFKLYLIQFHTGFSHKSRYLQIEVGGWCGRFRLLESSETNKQERLLFSMLLALPRTRIKHFH